MLLRVNLEEPLLVDVGYGCGLARSIPLAPNAQLQRPYDVSITALDGSFLRYGEQVRSVSGSYDFTLEPVERSYFDAACHRLQTDAASPFLRTLTAQQRRGDDHLVLRGLVLKTIGRDATQELVLQSKEELVHCLRSTFGLEVPSVADIWPKLKHRHDELFNSD
jgi:N-hydroxyarylamine O-acetyltransferase